MFSFPQATAHKLLDGDSICRKNDFNECKSSGNNRVCASKRRPNSENYYQTCEIMLQN